MQSYSDDSCILVKPNATKEEIEKMVDGEQGQLFAKQVDIVTLYINANL